jgi:hypothetical protein
MYGAYAPPPHFPLSPSSSLLDRPLDNPRLVLLKKSKAKPDKICTD